MPDISDAPSRLQDQQDGCRGSFDPCLTQPEHSSLFPRTTVADQSVDWLVTTSGAGAWVGSAAGAGAGAGGGPAGSGAGATGGSGRPGVGAAGMWAVGAAVEEQPLKLVVAGFPGELSDQGCRLP